MSLFDEEKKRDAANERKREQRARDKENKLTVFIAERITPAEKKKFDNFHVQIRKARKP